MSHLVLHQIYFVVKTKLTSLALIRFYAGMNFLVTCQMTRIRRLERTQMTLERLIAFVDFLVRVEVTVTYGCVWAIFAFIRFLSGMAHSMKL